MVWAVPEITSIMSQFIDYDEANECSKQRNQDDHGKQRSVEDVVPFTWASGSVWP
jgi:hypothetical protein